MNRVYKNKKSILKAGFTLLEMVLVLAILMIMATYLYGTFRIVHTSHLKVTVVNDMYEYASLNLQGIENHLLNATSITLGGADGATTISLDSNSEYVYVGSEKLLPGFVQYHNGPDQAKWSLGLKFTAAEHSKYIVVEISVYDNATPSSGVAYRDTKTIYCPSIKTNMAGLNGVDSIAFTTDPVPEVQQNAT